MPATGDPKGLGKTRAPIEKPPDPAGQHDGRASGQREKSVTET
jgi:hypothetical protein